MEGAKRGQQPSGPGPYVVEAAFHPDPQEDAANEPAAAATQGWKIRLAGRGAAKGSTRNAQKLTKTTPQGDVHVWTFRQDSIGILTTNKQAVISVADGHGPRVPGSLISLSSHLLLLPAAASHYDTLLEYCRANDKEKILALMTELFEDCDQKLLMTDPHCSVHASGGSTFTLNHKLYDPKTGQVYSVLSNVGDSPAIRIDQSSEVITEMSEDQNCDNVKAVERYCNLCAKKNEEPRRVILGRFNFQSPLGKRCAWMGDWGDWVEPYTYSKTEEGVYEVSHNVEVMRSFYERAPEEFQPALMCGGPQSLRARPANLEALSRGEYPSANFGSTLEGVLQMPFSLGDKADKHGRLRVKCEPFVNLLVDSKSGIEIMGTDGVMDCLPDDELRNLIRNNPDATQNPENFCNMVATLTESLAKENWFQFSSWGVPAWDDLGFWVIRFDPISSETLSGSNSEQEMAPSAEGEVVPREQRLIFRQLTGITDDMEAPRHSSSLDSVKTVSAEQDDPNSSQLTIKEDDANNMQSTIVEAKEVFVSSVEMEMTVDAPPERATSHSADNDEEFYDADGGSLTPTHVTPTQSAEPVDAALQ
eukprot:m.54580 g.54580  ORF g.54580 m.54580 type:complete len:589 (-) comp10935_c0_seq4:957-2723(-)